MSKYTKPFNSIIKTLISRLESKSTSEQELAILYRLKKRISLLKSTIGDVAILAEVAPQLIEYSEEINNRDENFLHKADFKGKILKSKKIRREDEFALELIDSVRVHYSECSQEEKDDIYRLLRKLLQVCLDYQISVL